MRCDARLEQVFRGHAALGFAVLAMFGTGCGSSGWNPTAGLSDTETVVSTTEGPAAIVAGAPVSAAELVKPLAEIAGADALREVALDREVARELEARGLSITEADIEVERDRLTAAFGDDEQGRELIRRVFESRSLGPHRLRALLERNASLRKLIVAPDAPTDAAIRVAYDVQYGPKRRVRLALLPTVRNASAARREIAARSADVGISAAFAEVAAARSTDSSAAVGGLLGPVSVADPGLSDVLRRSIDQLPIGVVGEIVALNEGFALVLVEADIPAEDTPFDTVRQALAASIAERSERLAMEALAETLIERADITPIDPGLRWSWQRANRSSATR